MTRPRKNLIDREHGGFYHLASRCVRRAWLSGRDPVTGRDYSHRRAWIEARLLALSKIFTVHVYGYAVMSNHYHIVLQYRPKDGARLTAEEVARRWLTVFPPNPEVDLEERISALSGDAERVAVIRARLSDLSWYMQCLNAPIARRSNIEDGCTGRFWEGRFYSKALPDERAVYACMAYTDLNPWRAGDTDRVDAPAHTALRRRLQEAEENPEKLTVAVAPITFDVDRDRIGTSGPSVLALSLRDYQAHVEWAAACTIRPSGPTRANQCGPPSTLADPKSWLTVFTKFKRRTMAQAALPRGMLAFGN